MEEKPVILKHLFYPVYYCAVRGSQLVESCTTSRRS